MKRQIVLLLAALVTAATSASAHESPTAEIAALDRKIAARPGDVSLLLRRAALFRGERRPALALLDLAVAEAYEPGRRDVALERGLALWTAGDRRGAEAELDRFLASGPPTAAALAARGHLREETGRLAAARADHDAALRLRPDPDGYLARGRADEAAGDLDRAAEGYEEGLLALSGAASIRLALLRVEARRGRFARAEALVDEVLASAPRKADWLLLRADVRATAGRTEEARADREAALRETEDTLLRRPSDLTRLTRAKALLALGRTGEALSDLRAVARSSPGLPGVNELLETANKPSVRP